MSLAEELLDLAEQTADAGGVEPGQAVLRRAVSTAYYALFHFVIGEATANWSQADFRPLLGRIFEHGKMKQVCNSMVGGKSKLLPFDQRAKPEDHLRALAKQFVEAQEHREYADYDIGGRWNRQDLDLQIYRVQDAMQSWNAIRGLPESQKFLVLLLGARDRTKPI